LLMLLLLVLVIL